MESITSLFVGFFMLVVFIILISCIYYYRRHKHHLSRFAEELGQDELISGKTYQGELNNINYFYEYYVGSKNNPSYFKVWIECDSQGEFRIGKESKVDSFFKKIGISVEIQTGDEEFDKRFYIQTDSIEFTSTYFNSADKRLAVNQLFDHDYNEILHNGSIIEVKNTPFHTAEIPDITKFEMTVKMLVKLAEKLPASFSEIRLIGRPGWKIVRDFIYTLTVISVISGFILLIKSLESYPPLDGSELFLYSLEFSLPVFILFAVVSVFLLKGRSSSHKHIMINYLIAIIGFPLTSYGALLFYNGWIDDSEINYYEAAVLGKRYSRSKNSTSYYTSIDSWRQNKVKEEIKVSVHTYNQVHATDSVMIIGTRQGHLGYEWLVSYRVKIDKMGDNSSLKKY